MILRGTRAPVRRVLALVALLGCGVASTALGASAPSSAIQVASARAKTVFATSDVHADFSLVSRHDPRWALVDGFATARSRPWAAWLWRGAQGAWELRYFVDTAPLEPRDTSRGRVPCDLVPAFSEPRCPPPPGAQQIRVQLARQLTSLTRAARIGTVLRRGGYAFSFTAPGAGSMRLDWYTAPAGSNAPRTLIARAQADFFGRRSGVVKLKLTADGARRLRASLEIRLRAEVTFVPIIYADVRVARWIVLRR